MILRPLAVVASLGCALALAGACSSSSSGGSGGAGGTALPTGGMTGTAGAAGAGGTAGTFGGAGTTGGGGAKGSGGAGGTFVANCGALPACVASVLAACPSAGDCSEAVTGAGNNLDTNLCYGVGTKVIWNIVVDPDTSTEMISITGTKNGATCYTLTGASMASGAQTMTFSDVNGVALATFSSDPSTLPAVTVTCTGGQPVVVSDFGNCGDPMSPEQNQCMGGRCVAP